MIAAVPDKEAFALFCGRITKHHLLYFLLPEVTTRSDRRCHRASVLLLFTPLGVPATCEQWPRRVQRLPELWARGIFPGILRQLSRLHQVAPTLATSVQVSLTRGSSHERAKTRASGINSPIRGGQLWGQQVRVQLEHTKIGRRQQLPPVSTLRHVWPFYFEFEEE